MAKLLRRICAALLLSSLLCGCGDDREIRHLRVPKTAQAAESVPGAPEAPSQTALRWKAPPAWKVLPAGNLRLASFAVSGSGGSGEASITFLAGAAGGAAANVNRWRGQLGLPALTEAEALKALQAERGAGGDFKWIALKAENKMLLASLHEWPAGVGFVKLNAPPTTAEENRDAFLEICRSLIPAAAATGEVSPP